MDNSEFYNLVEETVRQLMPRIPEQYRAGFDSVLAGGEFRMAIEDLIYAIVDDQVPVSTVERDTLYRLVHHLKQNDELLKTMEKLTIQITD